MDPLRAWARRKLRGGGRKKSGTKDRRGSKSAAGRLSGGGKPPGGRSAAMTEEAAASASRGSAVRGARRTKKDQAVEALARAAWVSIRKKGIKAKHFFREAEKKFTGIVETRVRAELRKVKA